MSRRDRVKLAFYKRSLRKWKDRHTYRQAKADYYHQINDRKGVEKWYRLMVEAGRKVRLRRRQIAALVRPRRPAPSSARAKAVAKAASYVGVVERPYGSNGGGIISTWQARFGFGRVAWCGIFCGNMLLAAGVRGVGSWIASVALIEDMAKRRRGCFRGWTTDESKAQRGDLAVIGNRPGVHVEMVAEVHADGSLSTIGGNVSQGVRRMRRPRSAVRGIALVNFPG